MRGLLIAGGDTKSGAGIAQVRDTLVVTSTCCDNACFWDDLSRLTCGGCKGLVILKPRVAPSYPDNLVLNLEWSGATPYKVHRFIEGWTGLRHKVDIEISVEFPK